MMVDVTEPPTTDLDLIRRAINGDHQSFAHLIQTHDDRMRAVAYQMMSDRNAMDDVLQISYLKAFRSLAAFRAEASFSSWLHRIVVNVCLDEIRKTQRKAEVSLESVANLASSTSIEDQYATSASLHTALQRLSPDMRSVVILVDGQGLSYQEAALILDTQAGTVASRLSRARTALRQHLGLPKESIQ